MSVPGDSTTPFSAQFSGGPQPGFGVGLQPLPCQRIVHQVGVQERGADVLGRDHTHLQGSWVDERRIAKLCTFHQAKGIAIMVAGHRHHRCMDVAAASVERALGNAGVRAQGNDGAHRQVTDRTVRVLHMFAGDGCNASARALGQHDRDVLALQRPGVACGGERGVRCRGVSAGREFSNLNLVAARAACPLAAVSARLASEVSAHDMPAETQQKHSPHSIQAQRDACAAMGMCAPSFICPPPQPAGTIRAST